MIIDARIDTLWLELWEKEIKTMIVMVDRIEMRKLMSRLGDYMTLQEQGVIKIEVIEESTVEEITCEKLTLKHDEKSDEIRYLNVVYMVCNVVWQSEGRLKRVWLRTFINLIMKSETIFPVAFHNQRNDVIVLIVKLMDWIITGVAKTGEIKDVITSYVTKDLVKVTELTTIVEEILNICQIKENQPLEKYQRIDEELGEPRQESQPVIEDSSSSENESSDDNVGLLSRLGRKLKKPKMYGDWVFN